jgi:regulation of enolase protein 1 (concanavalin A-like superfamily)
VAGHRSDEYSWSPTLRWLPGNNAVAHAVYVGTSSNAVAQATFASPEYQGTSATTNFNPAALAAQTMYFWRVDEIRGANMSQGLVWSFTMGPFLAHRYSFSESGGTSVADSAGGPAWAGTVHNGGTLGGGQLTLSSSSQQYVSLPAGIVGSLSGITLMAWVNLSSNTNWNRIFDFGNNTTSCLYLTPQNGNGGTPQFGITTTGSGGEQHVTSGSTLSTGVWHQVAVTFSGGTGIPGLNASGGSGVLYVDGVAVGTSESLTLNPSSLGNTVNNYIGKSQYGSDPCLNGSIDEFRIYNGALAANEIAQACSLGPTLVIPNLPNPWLTQDAGAVGVTGNAAYSNGVFTVTGGGADIQGNGDAFRFVYVTATGNCIITARVPLVQNIDPWSKAGVMIRESLNTNAANTFIAVTPGNGVTWQYRPSTGGGTTYNNTTGLDAPYWVRLVRSGNTFTGYCSADGAAWTQQGTATFTIASTVYVGLALTSHNSSSLCAATFDNVSAPNWPSSTPPTSPAGLSATAWDSQVVLNWPASSGATSYNVKRATTNGGPYTIVSNVGTTNCTDGGLMDGTNYYYVVSALNTAGESVNSAQASATPLKLPQPSVVAISIAGGSLVFGGTNGLAGRAYTIWSSTDLSTPPTNWIQAGGGCFDGNGNFNITNIINTGEAARYYLLRQP